MRPASTLVASGLLSIAFATSGAAQVPDSVAIATHYQKSELRIPMRDGTQLFTAIPVLP